MRHYDSIVIGVGGMGSSACYHLARQKQKVLGIEQFGIAHDRGSSHGETRLIRKAYFEHPNYVPLLKRSYKLWEDLNDSAGVSLLNKTGLVIYGPKQGHILTGTRKSAKEHSLPIENVSSRKFPQFTPPKSFEGVYEQDGGYLAVEKCVEAHIDGAKKSGADLRFNEKVCGWKADNSGVTVETDSDRYFAKKLILTAGPWSGTILADLRLPLKVHRVPLFWFRSQASLDICFAFDLPYGFIYGFPKRDGFVKIALHKPGSEVSDPTTVDRSVDSDAVEPIARAIRECLPEVDPTPVKSTVCMYTMTPDEHFIVDTHPKYPNVILAAGFSGHGFKFSSVIGEILADLAIDGMTRHPIQFLRRRA